MKTKLLLTMLVSLTVLCANAADTHVRSCCAAVATLPSAPISDKSIYQTESAWTTDAAKSIQLASLRGKPQVIAMFFASCQFTCPIIVGDLKRIEAALPENLRTNTGFTLVSFDSVRDTPAELKAYRASHKLSESDWTLLHGQADDVRELAALLGVNYRQDAAGNFSHSNIITVLNAEGEIVYQQAGLNQPPDEIVKKLATLFSK